MSYKNNKISGFTLIELLVTVAIAGILFASGVPYFTETLVNNKTQSYSSEFSLALYLAQNEAIKRGTQVSVTPKTAATGNVWQGGWDIFVDTDRDGSQDSGEVLIKTYIPDAAGFTLKSKDTVFGTYIGFSSTGSPIGVVSGTAALSDGGFRLCRPDNDTALSRTIRITYSGNVSTSKGTTSCP